MKHYLTTQDQIFAIDEGQEYLIQNDWIFISGLELQANLDRLNAPTNEQQTRSRQAAYISEADPLFFKAQRGEATVQEWQNKIAEIKARYPKEQE